LKIGVLSRADLKGVLPTAGAVKAAVQDVATTGSRAVQAAQRMRLGVEVDL